MIRLIDANALIDAMYNANVASAYEAQDIINSAPTIEPKRGRWIEQEDCWQCSECGDEFVLEVDVKPIDAKMNYCSSCGARMTDSEKPNNSKVSEIPTGSERSSE